MGPRGLTGNDNSFQLSFGTAEGFGYLPRNIVRVEDVFISASSCYPLQLLLWSQCYFLCEVAYWKILHE